MTRHKFVLKLWRSYNKDYFNGRLPKTKLVFMSNKQICKYLRGQEGFCLGVFYTSDKIEPIIALNTVLLDQNKVHWTEMCYTLVHEMIHEYVWFMFGEEKEMHGPLFQKIHKVLYGKEYEVEEAEEAA